MFCRFICNLVLWWVVMMMMIVTACNKRFSFAFVANHSCCLIRQFIRETPPENRECDVVFYQTCYKYKWSEPLWGQGRKQKNYCFSRTWLSLFDSNCSLIKSVSLESIFSLVLRGKATNGIINNVNRKV